jgi:hypothetical protein
MCEHVVYQDVLCCRNVVRFHDTRVNVILFMPAKKVQPYLRRFSRKLADAKHRYLQIS